MRVNTHVARRATKSNQRLFCCSTTILNVTVRFEIEFRFYKVNLFTVLEKIVRTPECRDRSVSRIIKKKKT